MQGLPGWLQHILAALERIDLLIQMQAERKNLRGSVSGNAVRSFQT